MHDTLKLLRAKQDTIKRQVEDSKDFKEIAILMRALSQLNVAVDCLERYVEILSDAIENEIDSDETFKKFKTWTDDSKEEPKIVK